jgi:NAD(P)-dependent dehydrogenase (short-subunit alcohol dehydrogenase family)
MKLLEGRVVIVAGAGPGMGRSVALRAAQHGASVVLAARTAERLAELRDEIESGGGHALAVPTDFVDNEQCLALVAATVEAFGRFDALVHTAFGQPARGPLGERTPADWHAALDVNIVAASQLVEAVTPVLVAQQRGSIVFVSSISARQPRQDSGIYAVMKAGALTLTKVYAQQLGPSNVRVNCVVPGYIDSADLERFFVITGEARGVTGAEARADVASATCLKRIPTAHEVADAAVFFVSDLSSAITGQALDVNAGHWFG